MRLHEIIRDPNTARDKIEELEREIERLRHKLYHYEALSTAFHNANKRIEQQEDEIERLRAAAIAVCAFDWSGNDDDAVETIERLREALR